MTDRNPFDNDEIREYLASLCTLLSDAEHSWGYRVRDKYVWGCADLVCRDYDGKTVTLSIHSDTRYGQAPKYHKVRAVPHAQGATASVGFTLKAGCLGPASGRIRAEVIPEALSIIEKEEEEQKRKDKRHRESVAIGNRVGSFGAKIRSADEISGGTDLEDGYTLTVHQTGCEFRPWGYMNDQRAIDCARLMHMKPGAFSELLDLVDKLKEAREDSDGWQLDIELASRELQLWRIKNDV